MATVTSLQDRIMIVELAQAGQTDRQIAQTLGWSLATIRKWRRHGQQGGPTALLSHRGRPRRGALSAAPPAVVRALAARQAAHPAWGPDTLRADLAADPAWGDLPLPSRASLARWRHQQGSTQRYQRHSALPSPPAPPPQAPHQVWELDAQGQQRVAGVGVVALINLTDRLSKAKLLSYPCVLGSQRAERHPTTGDYQTALRLAFTEWGLPDGLAVDHDSVFYDNRSPSPFPTRWHLWLLALGVTVEFGRPGRPTDRGTVERSHQTWQRQVLDDQHFANCAALRRALRQRRTFLNERLPCASLDHRPPLVAYPEARWPRRPYRPEQERALLDVNRAGSYLAQGRWFRRASNVGAVSLGGQVYLLGQTWARQEVTVHFDPLEGRLVFATGDEQQTKRLPISGLTPADLMGDLDPLLQTAPQQLPLPLTWNDWGVIRFSETLAGTT